MTQTTKDTEFKNHLSYKTVKLTLQSEKKKKTSGRIIIRIFALKYVIYYI